MPIAEIISFLIQAEPEVQALILSVINMIKANRAGVETADKAKSDALQALGIMMGRNANPSAQDAADYAAVLAEMKAKLGL